MRARATVRDGISSAWMGRVRRQLPPREYHTPIFGTPFQTGVPTHSMNRAIKTVTDYDDDGAIFGPAPVDKLEEEKITTVFGRSLYET